MAKKSVKKEEANSDKVKEKNLGDLFFKSNKFLDFVGKEDSYQKIIRNFVIAYLIYFVLWSLLNLVLDTVNYVNLLQQFITTVIMAVFLPFFASFLVYIFVRAFKGDKDFFKTFKLVTYILIIGIIYSVIALIINFIFNISGGIDYSILESIQTVQDPTMIAEYYKTFFSQPIVIISMLINLGLFVIQFSHQFNFLSKGLVRFNGVKGKGKAALSIILAIALFLIIFVLASLVFYSFS